MHQRDHFIPNSPLETWREHFCRLVRDSVLQDLVALSPHAVLEEPLST